METERTLEPPRSQVGLRLVIAGVRSSTSVDLVPPGRWTLGRADDADLKVDEPSLSRTHARLTIDLDVAGKWRIAVEDLGSTNGTTVRGRAVGSGERALVAIGEAIDLGGVIAVVQGQRLEEPRAEVLIEDPAMLELHRLADRVAATEIPVLITGETGVGKELMAEAIHARSLRRAGPLVRINCAALSGSLLESELFGHERGAFTGAIDTKRGLLESAAGGTLLLDEVGELPLDIQPKLLRVLEERRVFRLGAVTPHEIDVRFVSATNRDLEEDVAAGRFRRDLFYRLSGFVLAIPPLRERRSEIVMLAERFARSVLEEDARAFVLEHDWPGNVRELKNAMQRAALLAEGGPIARVHLMMAKPKPRAPSATSERDRIIEALDRCVGNQTRAAELLGISRRTLIDRMERYELPRPRKR